MLVLAQSPSHSIRRAALLLPAFCLLYLLSQAARNAASGRDNVLDVADQTLSGDEPFPSRELVRFWEELFDELRRAEPAAAPISGHRRANRTDFDPKLVRPEMGPYRPPDLITIPDEDRDALRRAHSEYVARIPALSSRLPFVEASRGVVMTVRGAQVGMAMASVLMLRRTGSALPVHLFVDEATAESRRACRETLEELEVQCFDFGALFSATPALAPRPGRFQLKVLAMLFSPLRDVLFLDADAFPVRDPAFLFGPAEPLASHGLVVWPDFWLPTVSPLFYDIASQTPPPELDHGSRSAESGVMLCSKAAHGDSLLLAAYYNFYGPQHYYALLSQGADGEGDKETFSEAARVLGKPAYRMRTEVEAARRQLRPGVLESTALKQADPVEDWQLHGTGNRKRSGTGRPGRQKGVSQAEEQTESHAEAETETSASVAADGGIRARPLFIHHNQVKIDLGHLGSTLSAIERKDSEGRYVRLWGEQRELAEAAGYDVERAMWREVLKATCRESLEAPDCERLRAYFVGVFSTAVGQDI